MFGSKMYLNKRRQTVLSTVRQDMWPCEEISKPRGFYLPRKTSSALRQLLYTHSDLQSEGDWKGEGRERGKTAIYLLFPSQSPLLLPGVVPLSLSLSLDKILEETCSHPAERIWENRLYRVLILWLFLQFLNFKWEYWNTDIDMKRFIVTIYHYYHRPYCY